MKRADVPHLVATEATAKCSICRSDLLNDGSEICPRCGSRARTRAIPMVLQWLGIKQTALPLLVFAATSAEAKALRPTFPALVSVSLYRNYLVDHETGVDARDLSRYGAGSFAGHFSSMLFDYFPEHELALAEAFRVVAPGGYFLTHIARHRLQKSDAPPTVHGAALAEGFPDIRVGADWFIDRLDCAGFQPMWVQVSEVLSSERSDWLIGRKPGGPLPGSARTPPLRASVGKELSCRLQPEFGPEHVHVRWSLPDLPRDAQFGAHAQLIGGRSRVVAVGSSSLHVSDDAGASWEEVKVAVRDQRAAARLDNAFILADGAVIAQARGLRFADDIRAGTDGFARIYTFDRELALRGDAQQGMSQWHGSGGIDEHGGTVIFAEYAENPIRWRSVPAAGEEARNLDLHIYRSRDGGLTWSTVLTVPWSEVRHFHTVRADRYEAGVWWASTGDRTSECRVFRSRDDGGSWTDATGAPVPYALDSRARSWNQLHRYTDLVVTDDFLIWGTDDYLGDPELIHDPEVPLGRRIGSRLCVARKAERIEPQVREWIGNPVRSIVDVGLAWLVVTQAKGLALPRPQLVLVGKEEPFPVQEIGTVDLYRGGSPFTFSRASRAAVNGRFFSFRHSGDVFAAGPGVLQWDVDFG